MIVIAIASVVGCVAIALGMVRRSTFHDTAAASPRQPQRLAVAEHDRIRPAVDAAGARIWLESDQAIWHEIVSWPSRPRTPKSDQHRAG